MKILLLNGSPRPNGNTAKMVEAFKEGAAAGGNEVNVIDVCRKNIKGCLACEYCHTKEKGQCVQKDDMQEVYALLKEAEMLVIASPIYYHGISGQLKCTIDRFYSAAYPVRPENLKSMFRPPRRNGRKCLLPSGSKALRTCIRRFRRRCC